MSVSSKAAGLVVADPLVSLLAIASTFFTLAEATDNGSELARSVKIKPRTRTLIASQLNRPEMVTYVNSCYNRPEIDKLIDFWLQQSAGDDLSFVNLRVTIIENYRLAGQSDFLVSVALSDEFPIQTMVRALEALVENHGRITTDALDDFFGATCFGKRKPNIRSPAGCHHYEITYLNRF